MSVMEHVISKLHGARVRPHPFPHFHVHEVFPRDFYCALLDALPPDEAYQSMGGAYKERLMAEGAAAPGLEFMADPRFVSAVLHAFPARADEFKREGRAKVRFDYRLVRDLKGYALTPHTDGPWKLASLLFYLPRDEAHPEFGTSLYTPKDRALRCPGERHWPRELFDLACTIPFTPNSCFGFWKTDEAWHGVEPVSAETPRDVLLFNLYRCDDEERGSERARPEL